MANISCKVIIEIFLSRFDSETYNAPRFYQYSTTYSPILSSTHRHPGSIIFAHSCLLEENTSKRILVTACATGHVKAWKLQEDGELSLMANFHSNQANLTSMSVAPVVVRLQVQNVVRQEDDTLSQSTLSKQSIHSKESEPKEISEPPYYNEYEIHCICGFSNGAVESWLISSNKDHSFNVPIQIYRENRVSVSKIMRIPQPSDNYINIKNFDESIFSPLVSLEDAENQGYFLVAYSDGSQCSLILSKDGSLGRYSYFNMPNKTNFIIAGYNTSPYDEFKYNLECILVSDLRLYEVLVHCADSSLLISKWKRAEKPPLPIVSKGGAQNDQLQLLYERQRNQGDTLEPKDFEPEENQSMFDSKTSQSYDDEVNSEAKSNSLDDSQSNSQSDDSSHSSSSTPSRKSTERSKLSSMGGSGNGKNSAKESPSATPRASLASPHSSAPSPGTATAIASLGKSSEANSREYVGTMESSQRIISTELHFAKKDRRLLELYTKNNLGTDGCVSPADAVEIVFSWLNSIKVARDSIWELLKLLSIKETDRLKFIEVAKIAAVVSSALNRTLQDLGDKSEGKKQKSSRFKNYQKLKSYTTKVSYNSMGEKVVERVELSKDTLGIYNGFTATIRRIWNEESCRVLTQADSRELLVKPLDVQLEQIPVEFQKLLKSNKLALPTSWLPSKNSHWFDPLRVIRIARTLLDMRSSKQHEIFSLYADRSSITFDTKISQVEKMEFILVKYFERNYGNKDLNITPVKVVNFLEACLQYQHHPIVNIIQGMLRLAPSDDANGLPPYLFEAAIWVCAEARSALCARGSVIEGSLMQPYNSDFNYMESFVKDGAVWQVRWQLVRRADAISIADEILRVRGGYGPAVYLQIFSAIESISQISNKQSYGIAEDEIDQRNTGLKDQLIDFECFLEVLFFEFLRYERMSLESEQNVFGEGAMALAINVIARDINSTKRKLIIDDQDFQYGFFHDANMAKIKLLLLEFIRFDPLRTGVIEQSSFDKVLRERGSSLLQRSGEEQGIAQVHYRAFMRVVLKMFLDGSPAAPISYIDLMATMLAWEFQCQGELEINLETLAKDIPEMKRSIEQNYANELVRYFSSAQLLDSMEFNGIADPIWVMAAPSKAITSNDSFMKSALSIPTNGDWVLNTAPPDDIDQNPVFTDGLNYSKKRLTLGQPAVVTDKIARSTKVDVHKKDVVAYPKVQATHRALKTIHGEVVASGFSAKPIEPCPISKSQILLNIPPFDPLQATSNDISRDVTRHSYSRGVADVDGSSSFIDYGITFSSIDLHPEGSQVPPSPFPTFPHTSIAPDGSIVVQLRSLLPPTFNPPQSPSLNNSSHSSPINYSEILNGFNISHASEEMEHKQQMGKSYSTSNLPPRSPGSPHRLGKYSKNALFSFSTSTDHLQAQSSDALEPLAFLNSQSESLDLTNDREVPIPRFQTEPSPPRHWEVAPRVVQSSSVVFPSSEAGVGVSACYGVGSLSNEGSIIESIAKVEVQNRLIRLRERDDEIEKMYQSEKEEFEKREREKRIMRLRIRHELKMKERDSMQFYYQAVEDRYRFAMKGKAQLDAALALEEEDKKQKELEIQAILARNKERSMQIQEQKLEAKRREEEHKKENGERAKMAKEDQLSTAIEKEIAAAIQSEKLKAQKLLQLEMEAKMKAAAAEAAVRPEPDDPLEVETDLFDSFQSDLNKEAPPLEKTPQDSPHQDHAHEVEEGGDEEVEVPDDAVADDEAEVEAEADAEEGDESEGEDESAAHGSSISREEEYFESVGEQTESTVVEEEHDVYSEKDLDAAKSEAERRLDLFIEKLESAYYMNNRHPRRDLSSEADGLFFVPLTFSSDIVFNPFSADAHYDASNAADIRNSDPSDKDGREKSMHVSGHSTDSLMTIESYPTFIDDVKDDDDVITRADPFADIKRSVKNYKKELEKQRSLLYSLDDMAPADFLRLYRVGIVKWNDFFAQEKKKEKALRQLENDIEQDQTLPDDDDDFFGANASDDGSVDSFTSADRRFNTTANKSSMPASFSDIPDIHTAVIIPLPVGKVLRKQRILQSEYKFYQIENTERHGLLTIEAQLKRGSISMYLARGYLPNSNIFEFEGENKSIAGFFFIILMD